MGWYGVSLCIKAKDWRATFENRVAAEFEADPDRVIEVACREIAVDEIENSYSRNMMALPGRTQDLVERAQAGLRALEARI